MTSHVAWAQSLGVTEINTLDINNVIVGTKVLRNTAGISYTTRPVTHFADFAEVTEIARDTKNLDGHTERITLVFANGEADYHYPQVGENFEVVIAS